MLLPHKILILCIRCNIISIMVIFTLNSMSHLALICNSKIPCLNRTLILITIAIIAITTMQSLIFRSLIVMYRHLLLPIIILSIISNSSHSSSTLLFILILVVNSSNNSNNSNNLNNNNSNLNNNLSSLGIRMIIVIK